MIADPYNKHINTVIGIEDVTKTQEEQELLTKRAALWLFWIWMT